MKQNIRIFLLFIAIVGSVHWCHGQKYDRHWLGRTPYGYKLVLMQFNEDDVSYILTGVSPKIVVDIGAFAISNAEGRLQFYTNGNVVCNHEFEIMSGGKGFNQGSFFDDWDTFDSDTTANTPYVPYTYQVIPDGYDDQVYYMLHAFDEYYWFDLDGEPPTDDCGILSSPKMQISKIDMSANGGRGKVVYKNRIIDNDTMDASFALVRHGNGRDWWLVLRSLDALEYKSLLLRRDSVVQVVPSKISELSSDWFTCSDWRYTAQNLLYPSPDGSMLVDKYGFSYTKLLSFDRCSGEVSLIDTLNTGIKVLIDPTDGHVISNDAYIRSFAFSPSGRFLYGSGDAEYAQWDLQAEDIGASKVTLGGIPWAVTEDQQSVHYARAGSTIMALGPDGKIYSLVRYWHSVIEHPDEKGEAAGICLAPENLNSCLGVPYNLFAVPKPNYRLGPLEGSPCDTIPDEPEPPEHPTDGYDLSVWPSPSSGPATVEITLPDYSQGRARIAIVDMLGRYLYSHTFPPYTYLHQLDVSDWASGVYNVLLLEGKDLKATARLVVIR